MGPLDPSIPIVDVDRDKCINCHACIAACPVKHCNDGSGDHVALDHDMCIACGACVRACTHGARRILDDLEAFQACLARGERMIAIVAPAVAAVFPDQYLKVNGWLKGAGVEAVFDVAFGAELTVLSYRKHMEKHHPPLVIAQPCPAIVAYLEIHRPGLLPHLAPVDSPMLHTLKMIRRYHPEYRDHQVVVLSPCGAKNREFAQTGTAAFNVTFNALKALLETSGGLGGQPEVAYDHSPAERAVLFSTPGGLLRTLERWNPEAALGARRIEGPHSVYPYLDQLPESLAEGTAPLLIDCLNCERGCNGGPGTPNQGASLDRMEAAVARRARELREGLLKGARGAQAEGPLREYHAMLEARWEEGLYRRTYVNRSGNVRMVQPTDFQIRAVFRRMEKTGPADELNCGGCGYGTCREMAVAIHNGRNKPSNCHLYKQHRIEALARDATEIRRVGARAELLHADMLEMEKAISEIALNAVECSDVANQGSEAARKTQEAMETLRTSTSAIEHFSRTIGSIADQTQLLALNATIEAAHAREYGRGFAVVASEVEKLAKGAMSASSDVARELERVAADVARVERQVLDVGRLVSRVFEGQVAISTATSQQETTVKSMSGLIRAITGEVAERIQKLEAYAAESE